MAVTKIIPIKATIQKAVDYICNPDKTDDELYIDCSNCSPFCAKLEFDFYRYRYDNSIKEYNQGVKAYHQIQSFKPGEVTPELAHKIGKEFAKREFGEKFAYIVTTHIDKEHIHNHIISCAYSTDGGNKYHNGGLKDIYRRRNLSDEICKENGLSVIEHNRRNWQTYKEWQTNKSGTSWKQELKNIIDKIIVLSHSWEEFLFNMQKENIIVNDKRKYITFQKEGKRAVRGNTLGENYSKEKISERIENEVNLKTENDKNYIHNERKNINRIIDTTEDKFQKNIGLNRWANKKNMETSDQLFNELRREGFNSVEDLRNYITDKEIEKEDLKEIINFHRNQLDICQSKLNAINDFKDFKKYTYGLAQAKDKNAFKEKYKLELNKFYKAEKYLKEIIDKEPNDLDELEIIQLTQEFNQELGANYISISEIEKNIKHIDDENLENLKNLLKQLDTYLGNSSKRSVDLDK